MVRQEAVDSLFAKPGTARRHCMMVSACIVFDVAIYPLMIWFLFIDVPDFLQSGPEGDENMVLLIKLVAMCGFTFVLCMYQVILFDLFGQHCATFRDAFLPSKTVPAAPPSAETEKDDEWNQRLEDPNLHAGMQPGLHSLTDEAPGMMLPGATHPSMMPVIAEDPLPVGVTTTKAQVNFQRGGSRSHTWTSGSAADERGKGQAFARRFQTDDHAVGSRSSSSTDPVTTLDGRCFVCSSSVDMASLTTLSCGHLVCVSCRPSKKGGACPSCKSSAGKNHEKSVSFDRETVFTYIKQTPVQTPR